MYSYLRKKVTRWFNRKGHRKRYGEYILLVPDLLYLLVQLMLDRRITRRSRTVLLLATVYFISPIDFFPELIAGPVGFIDDVGIAIYALNKIINRENCEVVESHWKGKKNILAVVQQSLESANRMVGGGMWRRIKRYFR
jgi:uncharacterized membrane protein YkvA (DUF1232 family)